MRDRASQARLTHPAMKQTPPSGVMAPRIVIPDILSTYRLPENSTVPAISSQPAQRSRALSPHWPISTAITSRPIA
ncbi:hypothetical protein D3C71_2113120 [compost metagenome]